MDAQGTLQIEETIAEFALLAIGGAALNDCAALPSTPAAEAHFEVVVVRATMRAEQWLYVECRSARAAAICGLVNVLDVQLAAAIWVVVLVVVILDASAHWTR